jgi:hypothetical protein
MNELILNTMNFESNTNNIEQNDSSNCNIENMSEEVFKEFISDIWKHFPSPQQHLKTNCFNMNNPKTFKKEEIKRIVKNSYFNNINNNSPTWYKRFQAIFNENMLHENTITPKQTNVKLANVKQIVNKY